MQKDIRYSMYEYEYDTAEVTSVKGFYVLCEHGHLKNKMKNIAQLFYVLCLLCHTTRNVICFSLAICFVCAKSFFFFPFFFYCYSCPRVGYCKYTICQITKFQYCQQHSLFSTFSNLFSPSRVHITFLIR